MKHIVLIGIKHYDPLGRQKIRKLLLDLKDKQHFIPDFIAVEWKEDYARRIISQRSRYRQLLAEKFPLISDEDLATLSNSLAYEADSHQDVYPTVPLIWLDEDRPPDPGTIIDNYAKSTLCLQAENLYYANISSPCDLQSFSFAANYVSDKTRSEGNERDERFFQKTCASISTENVNIIAIVGSLHVDPLTPHGYAQLLSEAGYDIEPIRLDVTSYTAKS